MTGLARIHAAPVFARQEFAKDHESCSASTWNWISGLEVEEPQKAAREFLLYIWNVPAGWSSEEWQLMAMVVRYHRGKQPENEA